ncbi:hypothetical protein SCP_1101680 [Sparassis crispa]|uniref:Transmembrane protein n=1 Tax=Sparassis crispa TaxID=139825 RepID=A0A401GZA2_9APHY|nr:hypothetical protein SCP_1101680 [Sparassis crispa]GBE87491.1 hypothetical protein SCP_1101680 [Sparassis crispa]
MSSLLSSFSHVFTGWRRAAPATDIEAQVISETSPRTSVDNQLPSPPCAMVHEARAQAASEEEGTDPLDDFFGVDHSSSRRGTHDSQHDDVTYSGSYTDLPPPYASAENPPVYTRVDEQPTLAQYLFVYGFLFPVFWFAGALILISPLRAPDDWESWKTEAERREIIQVMRQTEVKWAKRCLLALAVLAVMILVIVLAVVYAWRL